MFRGHKNDIEGLIIILYFVMLIYIVKFIYFITKQVITVKELDLLECDEIDKQLKKPILFSRWNYILTDKYLVNIRKFEVIKYQDIVLIYKGLRFNPCTVNYLEKHLYVFTNKGKKSRFLISYILSYGLSSVRDFSDIIKQKNPNVLNGKTKKNRDLIKQKYNLEL